MRKMVVWRVRFVHNEERHDRRSELEVPYRGLCRSHMLMCCSAAREEIFCLVNLDYTLKGACVEAFLDPVLISYFYSAIRMVESNKEASLYQSVVTYEYANKMTATMPFSQFGVDLLRMS